MPTATDITVRNLTVNDADRCATLMTLAFLADPPSRWLWPDPNVFLRAFPRFVRAFGGAAFDAGVAFATDDFAGAALWLPPGIHADDDALGALFEATVPEARLKDAFTIFAQMESFHPKEPHWHLPLIGVDPAFQRCGLGAALLTHGLELCDRAGLPAYLEATSPRNAAFYTRHGFERVGTIQTADSPEIIPMVRRPHAG